MSIASLGLLNNISLQNATIGNGTGNGGKLELTNDNNEIGIPNGTWTLQTQPSTDANNPNALTCGFQSASPSPVVGGFVLNPTGGSQTVGDGSVMETSGDLQVGGNVVLPNLLSTSILSTNASGQIIAGTPTGNVQQWTLPNAIFIGATALGSPFSRSYAIIDYGTRICTIFVNVAFFLNSSVSNLNPSIAIDINQTFFTNPASQPNSLPPPSALFLTYTTGNNNIFLFNDITFMNINTNPISNSQIQFYFGGYFVNAGIMTLSSIGTVSASSLQRLVLSGTMQYMF
jgi:hypothetical protein